MTTPTRQDESRQFDEIERLALESQALKIANSIPTTAAGEAKTTWDLTGLACDTKGPFRAVFRGQTVSATSSLITLRINASTANIERSGHYGVTSGTPAAFGGASVPNASVNSSGGELAGAKWCIQIEAHDVTSGAPRVLTVTTFGQNNPTTGVSEVTVWKTTFKSTDEIVSIGIATNVSGDIAAVSTARLDRI